jgi:hypothetical protein
VPLRVPGVPYVGVVLVAIPLVNKLIATLNKLVMLEFVPLSLRTGYVLLIYVDAPACKVDFCASVSVRAVIASAAPTLVIGGVMLGVGTLTLLTIPDIVAMLVLSELSTGLVNVNVPDGVALGTALNVIVV